MKTVEKVGVYIGRFQPFHSGHAHTLDLMRQECDRVVVLVGSSDRHRSIKNPFSFQERKGMITDYIYGKKRIVSESSRVDWLSVLPLPDSLYRLWKWKADVVGLVNSEASPENNVVLYGHFKDDSSYYLRMFPEWTLRPVDSFKAINASDVRRSYFESSIISSYACLPETTRSFLQAYKQTPKYHDLVEEWKFFEVEEEKYRDYPYPQTLGLMCSDALVVCQGFILLVKRKFAPGKGTWALPGGFKESKETFQECCVRELREETRLKLPEKVLVGSIKGQHMFDSPDRSLGVPRVTMAFHVDIAPNHDGNCPEVRAQSDVMEVKWVSLADAQNMELFDDHSDIVEYFI